MAEKVYANAFIALDEETRYSLFFAVEEISSTGPNIYTLGSTIPVVKIVDNRLGVCKGTWEAVNNSNLRFLKYFNRLAHVVIETNERGFVTQITLSRPSHLKISTRLIITLYNYEQTQWLDFEWKSPLIPLDHKNALFIALVR